MPDEFRSNPEHIGSDETDPDRRLIHIDDPAGPADEGAEIPQELPGHDPSSQPSEMPNLDTPNEIDNPNRM